MVAERELPSVVFSKPPFPLIQYVQIVFLLSLLWILSDLKFWWDLSERRSVTRLFESRAVRSVLPVGWRFSKLVLCHLSLVEANWQVSIWRGWIGAHSFSNWLNRCLFGLFFECQLLVGLPNFVGDVNLPALSHHVYIRFFIGHLDHLPGEVRKTIFFLLRLHLRQFPPSVGRECIVHGLPFYRTFCGLFCYLEISLWFTVISWLKLRVPVLGFLLYLDHRWAPVGL